MKLRAKFALTQLLILLLSVPAPYAQTDPPAQAEHVFTQSELDQMLAPIALYPDSLLSQILMASTYPLEVVEAARWSKANPGVTGDVAVRAVEQDNWDPSVKSLVAFPQILAMMDEKLDWTERLGDAFLTQEPQVMETVQSLRQRAYAAGNLKSNDQYRVAQQGQTIVVEPPSPEVVYVPYYDPLVVYGSWWWPAYPPVYWAPWPGYYARPGFVRGFAWGIGIAVGTGFFFGAVDWRHHHCNVVNVHTFYYHHANHRPLPPGNVWQHDPDHRRGVSYRNPSLRQQFGRTNASPETRREFRGQYRPPAASRVEPGDHRDASPDRDGRSVEHRSPPRATSGGARLNAGTPAVRPVAGHPGAPNTGTRPVTEQRPHVFEGVGQGRDVRIYSARGRSSSQQIASGGERSSK